MNAGPFPYHQEFSPEAFIIKTACTAAYMFAELWQAEIGFLKDTIVIFSLENYSKNIYEENNFCVSKITQVILLFDSSFTSNSNQKKYKNLSKLKCQEAHL